MGPQAQAEVAALKGEWIGVDMDGTLVEYEKGSFHPTRLGAPVPYMVARVKYLLDLGIEVRIFTARASGPYAEEAVAYIEQWTVDVFGRRLQVTNVKDYLCAEIWDDRAITVLFNRGTMLSNSRRLRATLIGVGLH